MRERKIKKDLETILGTIITLEKKLLNPVSGDQELTDLKSVASYLEANIKIPVSGVLAEIDRIPPIRIKRLQAKAQAQTTEPAQDQAQG